MAGGEGSARRRTAKSVEAAATGPQAPLRRCSSSTKTKSGKEAPATGPHGSSKGSSTKRKAAKDPAPRRMPLPRATRRKAKEEGEEEAAAATGAPGEQKYRLSKAYVNYILALKPMEPPARLAALKRSNPDLTPQPGEEADEDKMRLYILAKAFFEMEESLPRTQQWMRSELRKKGYVEFEGERAKGRAEVDALIDREWPAIEAKIDSLILEDKKYQGKEYQCAGDSDSEEGGKEYQGGDDSDSEEGEDSDESDDEDDEVF